MQPAELRIDEPGQDRPADIRADHEQLAMCEVDHEQDAVHHGVTKRDEAVDRAEREAEDELLRQHLDHVHGWRSRGGAAAAAEVSTNNSAAQKTVPAPSRGSSGGGWGTVVRRGTPSPPRPSP